ncbi:hypothetical protein EDB19DRAFT_1906587 [Suillus lakei]|nr:hypothetical protein EDB19DRAFT_1906587 [Suillus lakei]
MAPHTHVRTDLDGDEKSQSGLSTPQPITAVNSLPAQPSMTPNAPQVVYYPPATLSAVSIMVYCLSKTDLDKIKLLNRVKNNWTSWSELMLEFFHLNLLKGYTTGIIVHPDALHEPLVARNWDLNNAGIVAALRICVSPNDKQVLDGITTAHRAWNTLRSCHQKLGPIAQILKIQELLNIHYSRDTNLTETSYHLTEGVHTIFDMGIPTQ